MLALSTLSSVLAALGLAFVVLHPNIREGLFIKAGFILMILSLMASAWITANEAPVSAALNAGLVLRFGIVVACVGYLVKYRRARRDGGPTDFGSLTER